jgi:hypothetical protein
MIVTLHTTSCLAVRTVAAGYLMFTFHSRLGATYLFR